MARLQSNHKFRRRYIVIDIMLPSNILQGKSRQHVLSHRRVGNLCATTPREGPGYAAPSRISPIVESPISQAVWPD